MDLTKALAPKSDQLDFADLDGRGPQVFTITAVSENGGELSDQQPVNIQLAEFPRVWRPSKGMLRVLADNWGHDPKVWAGRRVELYGDPEVYFGKEKRGGTRISRLSHISRPKKTLVNPRGGRGAHWTVKPLPDAPPPQQAAETEPWRAQWQAITNALTAAGHEGDGKAMLATAGQIIGTTWEHPNKISPEDAQKILAAVREDNTQEPAQ